MSQKIMALLEFCVITPGFGWMGCSSTFSNAGTPRHPERNLRGSEAPCQRCRGAARGLVVRSRLLRLDRLNEPAEDPAMDEEVLTAAAADDPARMRQIGGTALGSSSLPLLPRRTLGGGIGLGRDVECAMVFLFCAS